MRLGSQSLQSEEGVTFSPRVTKTYLAADGDTFTITFSADAEVPQVWESAKTGAEGVLINEDGMPVIIDKPETKIPRSHWDMLLERRTRGELEELLPERLDVFRARRGELRVDA